MNFSKRTAVATAVLSLWATLLGPLATAEAHEERALHALTVLDEVSPAIAGLQVRVTHLTAPALVVSNRTSHPLVVLGEKGEPFLRIDNGSVEANALSPTSYRSADPTGERPLPDQLDATAPPRWTVLARKDAWSWFDPRLRSRGSSSASWEVPARVGRKSIAIVGGFESLDGHGHFVSQLDEVPAESGLELRLLEGPVPGIFVRNDSGEVLSIPGPEGEPFLRIGPQGVEANLRSPMYYLGGDQVIRKVPPLADPSARPRWLKVSDIPVWAWLEWRARVPATSEQRSVLGPRERTVLEWAIPARLGDAPLSISGRVDWIPPRASRPVTGPDEFPWAYVALIAAGIIVAGAAMLVVGKRAQRD